VTALGSMRCRPERALGKGDVLTQQKGERPTRGRRTFWRERRERGKRGSGRDLSREEPLKKKDSSEGKRSNRYEGGRVMTKDEYPGWGKGAKGGFTTPRPHIQSDTLERFPWGGREAAWGFEKICGLVHQ